MTQTPDLDLKGIIAGATRLRYSRNGNPSFCIQLARVDGSVEAFVTSTDSACAYDVQNLLRSRETVRLGLSRAGRVETITRVSTHYPADIQLATLTRRSVRMELRTRKDGSEGVDLLTIDGRTRKGWQGFIPSAHPAPALDLSGDFAADSALALTWLLDNWQAIADAEAAR